MPLPFGRTPDGAQASIYALENADLRVRVTDYGGRIVSIETADAAGVSDHVVLGFDSAAEYASSPGAFGALLGRTANRIGGGCFTLDGRTYHLSKNEKHATLHGGKLGFDKVLWRVTHDDPARLVLRHVSPDGDQGFPGEVSVAATYRLDGATLWLEFEAVTSQPTPLSLSAHPYFNLAGPQARDILDHQVEIMADRFLPTDEHQIPTGEICSVVGTVFDFMTAVAAGGRIRRAERQLLWARGYDHYFVLRDRGAAGPRLAARVRDPHGGRVLEILTTQPGTQFYTGNNLTGSVAGRGGTYRQSAGFAFEPQGFPDAPNHPEFPSTVLRPGEIYRHAVGYRFGC